MTKIFVFDTNSIISAHLLPASIAAQAYIAAYNKGMLVYSKETLHEFTQTFTRPKFDKYVRLEKRLEAISEFEKRAFPIEVAVHFNICRDPKDDKFLELANSAEADCIITGDKDLLVLHPFNDIPIISPADFLKNYLDNF